ncbi:hypothetical protein C8R47DRAFT_1077695 [Mycena vitilis]|nr:hypothetical protein C8R47DRAFT_1077695 [Mycena vitilis]
MSITGVTVFLPAAMSCDSPSPTTKQRATRERTRQLKLKRSARQLDPDRQLQQAERLRRENAKQVKRAQWKAASARYYENHPEVKEKKRLKMAEQRRVLQIAGYRTRRSLLDRATRKAARRVWDPPKNNKCVLPVQHLAFNTGKYRRAKSAPLAEASESSYGAQLQEEVVAVVSLLQLQQRQQSSPFPLDLPPSSDPGTSGDERAPAPSRRRLRPGRS